MGNIRVFFPFHFFHFAYVTTELTVLFKIYLQTSLDEEWYASYITRPEAEAALRKINQVSFYSLFLCSYKC